MGGCLSAPGCGLTPTDLRQFLDHTGTPPSVLGRIVFGDPAWVRDVLAGRRNPRQSSWDRLARWMRDNPDGIERRRRGRAAVA